MSVMLMALSTAALARPAPALLEVDNRFEGEVEVLVDGLYEGTVPGTRSLRMDVKPGRREVVVRRPNGGATLMRSTVHLSRDATARLRVVTPRTTVQLRNTGTVPLSIDLGPGDDLWLAPRTTTELRVDAGTLELTAEGGEFSDSWHQEKPVACEAVNNPRSLATVGYSYMETWGWRINLCFREPTGELVLQMTNIAPWGEEARAVRMVGKRKAG